MTDDDKALVKMLRVGDPYEVGDARHKAADRIESLSAENKRLNTLINETGGHWLALQNDHPIIWEGTIDAAMKAACDEIRRLRGITKPDPLVDAIHDADEAQKGWASAKDYAEHLRAALAKRGLEIREKE